MIEEHFETQDAREPGALLGLRLNRLSELSDKLDGLQPGLLMVGAETNVGKTQTAVNIALDILESNPESSVVFASLDDPFGTIVDRMTSVIAWHAFERDPRDTREEYQRARAAAIQINRFKRRIDDPRIRAARDAAREKLLLWARAGRFQLADISKVYSHAQLETMIRAAARRNGPTVLVIDALYNLDVGFSGDKTRELNIARANFLKDLSTRHSMPVLVTAELRKAPPGKERNAQNPPRLDALMETSKYSYNSDVVCMVYPKDPEAFASNDTAELVLHVQKNKHSGFKGRLLFDFRKLSGVLEPTDRTFTAVHKHSGNGDGTDSGNARRSVMGWDLQ
jgi:replicative DNA helicase